jgi:aspartyl-tRNA(Asn)/glutamyl-tRNA(Gln) amidotransferase subunit A
MAQQAVSEDIVFASVRDLGNRLRAGKLSPVALTEAYLDRLEKIGPKLNAVVTVTRELGLEEARQAEKEIRAGRYRGPLHGIPYGLKDLLATRGIPTTWGAEPYRNQTFDFDGTVVRKLREAGAILVAKLSMVELAGGFGYNNADASFNGPGRTPWNTDYWSGGSSSGPGSAVSAGLVAFAIGSETSGSIMTPAAFCGISGLRPTYGRVSRHGAMALSWTLDKLGPMCRTADDCGLVLAAIAGRDTLDASTTRRTFAWGDDARKNEALPLDGKKWRIGVIKGAAANAQPAVRKNFEAALDVLRKIATIDDVPYPTDLPIGPVLTTLINADAANSFRDLLENGRCRELRAVADRHGGYAGLAVLAVDYLQAMRVRATIKRRIDLAYAHVDAIVAPTRNTVAYPIAVDFNQAYRGVGGGPPLIPAGNLAGQPAISVPNGFGDNNLPTGLQFTGRAWSEPRLIALAKAYQDATDFHTRRPKLA